ncbi:O-antigen ligase family protein [Candidatus Daviesbacteria bacterium]|nr:O-antigen ligase family protein [Candidatus Daviesbacteria bacterium]
MKHLINTYSNWVFKVGVILVILSTLFLFTNFTTDFYEPAKFLALLFVTGLLFVLLTFKFTLSGKITWVRTPLDIPLILLLAVAVVSTAMSDSTYISLLGHTQRIHGSLIALVVYLLFYFLMVNFLSKKDIKFFLYFILGTGTLLGIISLMAYMGLKLLPPPWTHDINFTPTGSPFSTSAVLTLLLPIVMVNILTNQNPMFFRIINGALLALFGTTIALTGTMATWVTALIAVIVSYLVAGPREISQIRRIGPISLIGLIGPILIVAFVAIASFAPLPNNFLGNQAKNFPKEVQLPFIPSWKISVSSFRDSPFWGSGPASYLFDFTKFKPIEFNSSSFWNIKFDSSFNEYLQVLAGLGGVGLMALLAAAAMFASVAILTLKKEDNLKRSLALSGLVFFILLALHSSTLVLWVIGLILLALFFVSLLPEDNPYPSTSRNFSQLLVKLSTSPEPSVETIRIEALPAILLIVSFGVTLLAFFFGGKFALADYHHRLALNAVSQNQLLNAYNSLVAAERLNSVNDLYRTDLAQTNLALANAIVATKGPTEGSPSGSLTDADRQNIQTLLQQTINEGRIATALSPRSAVNWEILGLLYRQIAVVADNALVFSLDSYGKAIFQDPLNPTLRLNVGGVYYAIQNYDLAIRFFTDAINLKPDFANGYYNLSVAFREKGDLNSAVATAKRTLELIDVNSPDYKVVSDYLTDLNNRIASGTTQQSDIAAPASQAAGAIEGKNLPNVEVGKPDKIATPPAVKKPNATPEPASP